jgi:hypothetical protein
MTTEGHTLIVPFDGAPFKVATSYDAVDAWFRFSQAVKK